MSTIPENRMITVQTYFARYAENTIGSGRPARPGPRLGPRSNDRSHLGTGQLGRTRELGATMTRIKATDGATAEMIRSRKSHSEFGMHRHSLTGACMCTKPCCQSESGCCCKTCSGVGHVNCLNARIRIKDAER